MNYKNKKPLYSFNVRDAQDIDIQRILDEAPTDQDVVLLTRHDGCPVALFVRDGFLNRFTRADNQKLLGVSLCPSWGRSNPIVVNQYGLQSFHFLGSSGFGCGLDGWRWETCSYSDDPETELKAAREYVRRIPVRVYYL